MQIQIEQSEIEEAIVSFLRTQGITLNIETASIEFTASRKGRGIVADIETNVSLKAATPSGPIPRAYESDTENAAQVDYPQEVDKVFSTPVNLFNPV